MSVEESSGGRFDSHWGGKGNRTTETVTGIVKPKVEGGQQSPEEEETSSRFFPGDFRRNQPC